MATQRRDGRFQAVAMLPSGRKTVYGKTAEDADEKKRIAETEAFAVFAPTPSIDLTLHDLAGMLWYPEVEATARPNTLRRYRDAYKTHIEPKWGHRTVDTIRTTEIQQWVNWLAKPKVKPGEKEETPGAKPASISLYRSILSAILKRCVREGLISTNPATFVKTPKIRERRRVLSVTAARDLIAAVEGTPLGAPIYLAVVLGMRRGEICGLKWSNVDMKSRRITINEQRVVIQGLKKGKGIQAAPVKTDSSERTFRLPQPLFDMILRLGNQDSAYVCTEHHTRPWNPEHLTSDWAAVRDSLGFKDWHLHDLRHGSASILVGLGVDLLTVAAILGHGKIDTTMLYAHAQEETATEGFERLGEALFSSRTPSTDTPA